MRYESTACSCSWKARRLRLSCVGACVPQPDESKQTVSFESVARKECIEQVSIKNPTQKPIFVAPTLKHSGC